MRFTHQLVRLVRHQEAETSHGVTQRRTLEEVPESSRRGDDDLWTTLQQSLLAREREAADESDGAVGEREG